MAISPPASPLASPPTPPPISPPISPVTSPLTSPLTSPPAIPNDNPTFFGNGLTPWADLTVEQRLARSSPTPLKKLVSGYYAWKAIGDLRLQWNELGFEEYSKAVGGATDLWLGLSVRKESVVLSYDVRLLCVTETRENAIPYIIVSSNNAKAAEAAISKIKHHQNLVSYPYECVISLTGLEASASQEVVQTQHEFSKNESVKVIGLVRSDQPFMSPNLNLCGARISVYAHGRGPGSKKNVATIGGVFRVGQDFFALTAAHAFYHVMKSVDPWIDGSFYGGNADTGSGRRGSLPPDPRPNEVFEIIVESLSHSNSIDNEQQSCTVKHSMGFFEPAPARRTASTGNDGKAMVILEQGLDWALIELRNPKFWTPSFVTLPSGQRLTLQDPSAHQQPPEGDVGLAAGLSGMVTGLGLGTASGVVLPWSNQKIKAWPLECQIAVGDCGSLAFNPTTGEVYGMVLVRDPNILLTYLLPAPHLYDSIALHFSAVHTHELPSPDLLRPCLYSVCSLRTIPKSL